MLGLADAFMGARRQRLAEDESAAARAEREERMRWAREDRDRLAKDRATEDAAFGELAAAQSGVSTGDLGRIQQTYGMTPQQIAAAGGPDKLREQLAAYDQPDSWDLQGAPAIGAGRGMPTPTTRASDLKMAPAKKSDTHSALMKVALARRDTQGFSSAMAARDTAQEDELMGSVKMAAPGTPEWDTQMAAVRQQLRGHKQITIGKPDNKGFVNMSYEDAGGDTVFTKLSAADQHTLLMANALLERNPTRALTMIRGVNAELAAAIARDNDVQYKVGGATNETAYKRGALTNQEAQTANTAAYHRGMLKLSQARAEREKASDKKLDLASQLAAEAEGVSQGFSRAQGLGKEGASAAGIYGDMYNGLRVRGAALGLRLPDLTRKGETMTPMQQIEARAKLKSAGYPDEQIEAMVTGYDPVAAMAATLAELKARQPAGGKGAASPNGQAAKPVSDGRTNFGMLTPRSDLEREVAAGNPHAIRYMEAMNANAAAQEAARLNPLGY